MTADRDGGRRFVVAGVSALAARRSLVAWAAGEAAARGAELLLLTARPAPAAPDRYLPTDPAPAHHAAAERELADMAAYVRTDWPGLVVSTELVLGLPGAGSRPRWRSTAGRRSGRRPVPGCG